MSLSMLTPNERKQLQACEIKRMKANESPCPSTLRKLRQLVWNYEGREELEVIAEAIYILKLKSNNAKLSQDKFDIIKPILLDINKSDIDIAIAILTP